jgi:hypothetical protein
LLTFLCSIGPIPAPHDPHPVNHDPGSSSVMHGSRSVTALVILCRMPE